MFANARKARPARGTLKRFRPTQVPHMEWNEVARNWSAFRVRVKEQWSKLTDIHLDLIAGSRERLIGRIREVYGISQEQTEKQVSAWLKRVTNPPRVR